MKKRRKHGKQFAMAAVGMASVTLVALSGMFRGSQNVRRVFLPQPTKPLIEHLHANYSQQQPYRAFGDYRIAAMSAPMPPSISNLKTNNTFLTSTRFISSKNDRNRKNDDNHGRPRFFLHVGIPKTATTFLQCSICKDYYTKIGNDTQGRQERFFLQDNLVYIGTCPCDPLSNNFVIHGHDAIFDHEITWDEQHELGPMPFSNINASNSSMVQTSTMPKLRESFCTRIQQVHAQGHDAIIIFEGFHKFDQKHVEVLANFLNPLFRVQVILAYRRLFEWLLSKYNSINKPIGRGQIDDSWPGTNITIIQSGRQQNKTIPLTMPFALDRDDSFGQLVRDIETWQQHPAHIVRDNYARYFPHVEIIPLHDVPEPRGNTNTATAFAAETAFTINPYLHHLFCFVLSTARHVCQAIRQGRIRGSEESNQSVSLDNFRLAEAAYQKGWIPSHMSRSKVAQLAQDKMCKQAHLISDTTIQQQHLLECLPNATLNRLLNLSLTTEANLFGTQLATTWRLGHERAFEEYRSKNKYCWLDTAALLRLDKKNANNGNQNKDWMKFFKRLGRMGNINKQ